MMKGARLVIASKASLPLNEAGRIVLNVRKGEGKKEIKVVIMKYDI